MTDRFESFSREEFIQFLLERGDESLLSNVLTDIDSMDNETLMAIAISLGDGDDRLASEGSSSVGAVKDSTSVFPLQAATMNRSTSDLGSAISSAHRTFGSYADVAMDIDRGEEPVDAQVDDSMAVDHPTAATASNDVNEEQEQKIITFLQITGCDFDDAKKILSLVDYDTQAAMTQFWENGSSVKNTVEAIELRNSSAIARAMDPSLDAVAHHAHRGAQSAAHRALRPSFVDPFGNDSDGDYNDYNRMMPGQRQRPAQQYDADGIRLPDSVVRQRLVDGPFVHSSRGIQARMRGLEMASNIILGRADEPGVEWIYEPPRHLSFPGAFQEARALAKNDKKWLLVNIQSHNEFSSHRLNRETWGDEIIGEILRQSFVFWQRGHTSGDGRDFMATYGLVEGDLPVTGILDARTGLLLLKIKGFIQPLDLSSVLVDFAEKNSVDGDMAPALKEMNTNNWSTHYQDQMPDSPVRPSAPLMAFADDDSTSRLGDVAPPVPPAEAISGSRTSMNAADFKLNSQDRKELTDKSYDDKWQPQQPLSSSSSSSIATTFSEPTSRPVAVDFGPIPPEPEASDPEGIRISIKLASGGKPLIRRFHKNDRVRSLFAVAAAASISSDRTNEGKAFDIVSSFPSKSLACCLDNSLGDSGLANSQVLMRWE